MFRGNFKSHTASVDYLWLHFMATCASACMWVCVLGSLGSPGLFHNLAASFPVIKWQLASPAVGWNQPVSRVDAPGGPSV